MVKIIFFCFLSEMNVWIVWNIYIYIYIYFIFFLRHKHPVIELAIFCIFEGAISLPL